ncbi:ribonuclease P protein component [Nigerium massiliense]|uniref:ribonuclease P protein component n=1 Tax=Nigerium massiliense TaxID=1522317 RepID=UPI00058F1E82|nr:ribonuclease P protein component [Nigerium massiliense]
MLPADARLRSSDDFRATVRRGVRVSRQTLVLHALRTPRPPARAGFVVSKAVGNAVTRNRVKRQLRHLTAEALATTTTPLDVVVRALPAASAQPATTLRADFWSAWDQSLHRLEAA